MIVFWPDYDFSAPVKNNFFFNIGLKHNQQPWLCDSILNVLLNYLNAKYKSVRFILNTLLRISGFVLYTLFMCL